MGEQIDRLAPPSVTAPDPSLVVDRRYHRHTMDDLIDEDFMLKFIVIAVTLPLDRRNNAFKAFKMLYIREALPR